MERPLEGVTNKVININNLYYQIIRCYLVVVLVLWVDDFYLLHGERLIFIAESDIFVSPLPCLLMGSVDEKCQYWLIAVWVTEYSAEHLNGSNPKKWFFPFFSW